MPENKLLLVMPLAPTDIKMGIELAKLWADLEPRFNPNVSVLIALRFDMKASSFPEEVLKKLGEKFNILPILVVNRRKGTGWPAGCNSVEVGAYEWFVESNRSKSIDFPYMLLAEADTLPLRPTWLKEITKEAYDSGSLMIGAYFVKSDGCPHINGNACMHRDLWKSCKRIFQVPSRNGWDAYIGPQTLRLGKPSRLIWQDYRLGAPDNPWRGDNYLFDEKRFYNPENPLYGIPLRPAMLHGCKILAGIEAVRKKFSLNAN